MSGTKNSVFVESGRRGAAKRWGARRHVRLTDLEPSVAAAVRALLEADAAAKAAARAAQAA